MIKITINSETIECHPENTILKVADYIGIYVPRLCSHPDLPMTTELEPSGSLFRGDEKFMNQGYSAGENGFKGCGLCVVEVQGNDRLVFSCRERVTDGMVIDTTTPRVIEYRQKQLSEILSTHPHACLTCAQREGCTREPCSTNVPVVERCCELFGNCELQKVAEHVGILASTPKYAPRNIPIINDEPLITRNYELCIGCLRCVRACNQLRGINALGYVVYHNKTIVGTGNAPSLLDTTCKFCTACIEVCPTGALLDKNKPGPDKENILVPCRAACPAHTDVPQYVRFTAEKKFGHATAVIRQRVPFPLVLGHICFHPCEDHCRRKEINDPLAICAIKRLDAENDTGSWKNQITSRGSTGKKVAVIGAGPAGFTAAYYLALKGHQVTVLESAKKPGGMLMYGIPEFRLPRKVVEEEINVLLEQGITLETGQTLGEDFNINDLKEKGYNAILIATGLDKGKRLEINYPETDGIYSGMEFLRSVNEGKKPGVKSKVIVVGGGNVAVDVARSALRLGAETVDMVCLESRNTMPAFKPEIEESQQEGIKIHNGWGPDKLESGNKGMYILKLVKCISVFNNQNQFDPVYDSSVTTELSGNTIIFAIGQESSLSSQELLPGLEYTPGGLIETTPGTGETNLEGVYAAGDIVTGPGSVVEAIAHARQVAAEIDVYLDGDGDITQALVSDMDKNPNLGVNNGFSRNKRQAVPELPVNERIKSFKCVSTGYTVETGVVEAQRCLQCDLRLEISANPLPPEKWIPFNRNNIQSGVPEVEGVYQLYDKDKNLIKIKGTPTLQTSLMEELNENDDCAVFLFEVDPMYTQRESELMQLHLQEHGSLPDDDLDDLF